MKHPPATDATPEELARAAFVGVLVRLIVRRTERHLMLQRLLEKNANHPKLVLQPRRRILQHMLIPMSQIPFKSLG